MKIKTLFAATLLSLGFLTGANAQVVAQAYEVALGDFRAPVNENGTAAFKTCSDCNHTVVHVTASTRYEINGKVVLFEDFRKALKRADSNTTDLIVVHHLESNTIKSIIVSL